MDALSYAAHRLVFLFFVPCHRQSLSYHVYSSCNMPVRRGRKRGRSTIVADGDERNDIDSSGGRGAAESGGMAAVADGGLMGDESAEDYSSMEYWDKRYRDGVFVEWYCGFEHVRPLFERFVPKVRNTCVGHSVPHRFFIMQTHVMIPEFHVDRDIVRRLYHIYHI